MLPGVHYPAMYLHGSIGCDTAITINGDVWVNEYELDGPGAFQEKWCLAAKKDRLGFLVIAARRIPELLMLLPRRSPESPSCSAAMVRATGTFGQLMAAKWLCPAT